MCTRSPVSGSGWMLSLWAGRSSATTGNQLLIQHRVGGSSHAQAEEKSLHYHSGVQLSSCRYPTSDMLLHCPQCEKQLHCLSLTELQNRLWKRPILSKSDINASQNKAKHLKELYWIRYSIHISAASKKLVNIWSVILWHITTWKMVNKHILRNYKDEKDVKTGIVKEKCKYNAKQNKNIRDYNSQVVLKGLYRLCCKTKSVIFRRGCGRWPGG